MLWLYVVCIIFPTSTVLVGIGITTITQWQVATQTDAYITYMNILFRYLIIVISTS